MKLLTQAIRATLPKLYAQEKLGDEAIVYVKFFAPVGNWTWYATEFDGTDTFFGLVVGHETEMGYFSLSELSTTKLRWGLGIERDTSWTPKTLADVRKKLDR